jgi:alkyldihydroxyacetonephosphate synthase
MRLQDRPQFRASATARFSSFEQGVQAARALAQSGLHPSNCRLLDATEAMITGTDDGSAHLLLIGFESADHSLDAWLARAVELARDNGGEVPDVALRTRTDDSTREGSAGAWRSAFLRAPYTRDALVAMGMVNETFETRSRGTAGALYGDVMDRCAALLEIGAEGRRHLPVHAVYPDGPAPYFTVIARASRCQLEQWAVIKDAASDALVRHGATITHHHAVGRDHRRWYDQQRPPLFAEALRSAKATLDPRATLNPGVLVDP